MRCEFLLIFLFCGGAAQAQDALYGKQAPKGSAFIRIVNALDFEVDVKPDFLPAQKLGVAPAERVGHYGVVENVLNRNLQIDITSAGRHVHQTIQVKPDQFLTILLYQSSDDAFVMVPISDLTVFNQNRAKLSFYNAASSCRNGALALVPYDQLIFSDVASGASQARPVSPVETQIRASCALLPLPPMALSGLEAGGMVSVWLMSPLGQAVAFVSHDVVEPYRP